MNNKARFVENPNVFASDSDSLISNSILQNWTLQAFECYSINCDCSKCSIKNGGYSFACQMSKVVKKLLKRGIKPDMPFI